MSAQGVGRAIIEVDRLSKQYGEVHAVDEVSFSVAEGEIVGRLGHNGTGAAMKPGSEPGDYTYRIAADKKSCTVTGHLSDGSPYMPQVLQ